jgi:hypothetical protein
MLLLKVAICAAVIIFFILKSGLSGHAADAINYNFEEGNDGWVIPDWAYYQSDHKAEVVEVSIKEASSGKGSLALMCDFPGDVWAAALVEHAEDLNLSKYSTISADIYLPKGAPKGIIQARFILTVGIGWHFTEMRQAVLLVPGRWTKLEAKLESEEAEASDWKGRKEKRLFHHINNVRKIAIRIEYDASPPYKTGHRYKGPVYIDNVVIK